MRKEKVNIPGIKHIIAVASGKGGVGKSTVAFNLAALLQKRGYKVGLLDADIYGSSLPSFLGKSIKIENKGKKFMPHLHEGTYMMSLGFLFEKGTPIMWKGPILQTAIRQLFVDVDWPALDILIVDMPPGTGDAHILVGQTFCLTGALIVSTSQDIAVIDAEKCLKTFQKLDVPILGIIENMKTLVCPHCKEATDVFHGVSLQSFAKNHQVPFLGSIPLDLNVVIQTNRNLAVTEDQSPFAYASLQSIIDKFLETPHI